MNYDINIGFSRVDITPPLDVSIAGYANMRYAKKVLDPIEVNCLAVEKDGTRVVILALDNLEPYGNYGEFARKKIIDSTGLPDEAVFLHFTHTHTSPLLRDIEALERNIDREYALSLIDKLCEAALLALGDLTTAKMGISEGSAERIAFNRRYLMKDGSTVTNPGVGNPNAERCIGPVDERVNLIRFVREDKESIMLISFGNHPDTIGGDNISADWPGLTRRTFERAVPNTKCIVLNGALGDLNHINVFPEPHELADTIIDFDDVPRGYAHTQHMANVLTAAALSAYGKMRYIDVDSLSYLRRDIKVPTNMPAPEEIEPARRINELRLAGRENELPYNGMMMTTVLYEAKRILALENGPEFYTMSLFALKIGSIAFISIPGEPFAGIGISLKETEGFDMITPMCITNGSFGYFPMQDSFDEGGYEARSSLFRAGVAELIIDEGKKLLKEIK